MNCLIINIPKTLLYYKGQNISNDGELFDNNLCFFRTSGTVINITENTNGGLIYEIDATPFIGYHLKMKRALGAGQNTDVQCAVTNGKINGLDTNLNGLLASYRIVDLDSNGELRFEIPSNAKYIYFRDNATSQSPTHDYIQVSLYCDDDIEEE